MPDIAVCPACGHPRQYVVTWLDRLIDAMRSRGWMKPESRPAMCPVADSYDESCVCRHPFHGA